MLELTKAETRALRRDLFAARYDEYREAAASHGMTDVFLWTINFKCEEEKTSNAMAPLRRILKPHLQGRPPIMFGVLIPSGGSVGHRHGHGFLFLPPGLDGALEAARAARNANAPRSYQFLSPDPAKGGVERWIEYCMCLRNGSRDHSEDFNSRLWKRQER